MEKNDLNSVIAGLAGLGEIYLRISDKIRSLYEKDPKLKFEAELLMAKAGYAKAPLMKDLVDDLLGLHSAFASSMSDRILLRTYGDKFNDTVLLQETVNEFAAAGDEKKETLRERIRRQLSIFPDPDLGCGDLARFGYREYDLFPVSKGIAMEISSKSFLTVYGIFADGKKAPLSGEDAITSHPGMFGVKKSEWITWYFERLEKDEPIPFTFRESEKEFRIYQWDDTDKEKDYTFMPYHMMQGMDVKINISRYRLVYESKIRRSASLDDIFEIFNIDRPSDFKGHSLSVSDVVAIKEGEIWTAYFVDSFGFAKIEEFFIPDEKKEKVLPGEIMPKEAQTLPDHKQALPEVNDEKKETKIRNKRTR